MDNTTDNTQNALPEVEAASEVAASEEVKAPTIDTELVAKLTAELEAFNKSLHTKVYPIKIGTETDLTNLMDFINTKATWKNMEALGIIEVSKVLNDAYTEGLNDGNMFLQSLPIQALSFFLSKVEDKGLEAAQNHIKFVKPVDDALKLIKIDNDTLNKMDSELSAAENGISLA